MKLFITFTRSKLIAITSAVLLAVLIAGQVSEVKSLPKDADTNEKRINFAHCRGYEVEEECIEAKEVCLPKKFSDVYERYNELQKQSGYDLKAYAGCNVTVYKYKIKNKPNTFLSLVVYNGRVIGGDIADTSVTGEMKPL